MFKELRYTLENDNPALDTRRYFLKCPEDVPTATCGISVEEILNESNLDDVYSILEDVTVAPKLQKDSYVPSVKQVGWSPVVSKHKLRCLLSVLTDSGSLALYHFSGNSWTSILSVSQPWLDHCRSQWGLPPSHYTDKLNELKSRTYTAKISAFCWAGLQGVTIPWYCLFTGTLNGEFAIWKVQQDPDTKKGDISLLKVEKTELKHIRAICSHPLSNDTYIVFLCYFDGQIQSIRVIIKSDAVFLQDPQIFWEDSDKIQVYPGGMVSTSVEGHLYLTVIKGNFIIIFYMDHEGSLMTYEVIHPEDWAITGLSKVTEEQLLVTGASGSLFLISLKDGINFSSTIAKMQDSHRSSYSCYGLALSKNSTIAVLTYSLKTHYDHLVLRELSQMVWCTVNNIEDIQVQLSSFTGYLTNVWDIIDLLRIEAIQKNVEVAWTDPSEELDTIENYELKKILIFSKLTAVVNSNDQNMCRRIETLNEEIKALIMSCHVFKTLSNMGPDADKLSSFQKESISLMKEWLNYIIEKYSSKFKVTCETAVSLLDISSCYTQDSYQEKCQICQSKILKFTGMETAVCERDHRIPRCSFSLVQCLDVPYYMCPQCSVLVHKEAVKIGCCFCIFCDCFLRPLEGVIPADSTSSV